jgi:hypothetical protein
LPTTRSAYSERELTLYIQCPARYKYEVIEELRGGRDDSAYIRFHRCVYVTVGWVEQQKRAGTTIDVGAGLARLAAEWASHGPVGYAFESYYRSAAEDMVKAMVSAIATEPGQYEREEWLIPIGAKKVSITPDRVLVTPSGVVRVQRIRTGRKTKAESCYWPVSMAVMSVPQAFP